MKDKTLYAALGILIFLAVIFSFQFFRPVANYSDTITIYHSPTCGCCELYENYLRGFGLQVNSVEVSEAQLAQIKAELGIPQNLWSCHTVKIGNYFVEGHVPIEAINKLLEEKPNIKGIALPGMPPGSPGMSGIKTSLFTIYAYDGSNIFTFIKA